MRDPDKTESKPKPPLTIETLTAYVAERLAGDLRVKTVAKHFGQSEFYFHRNASKLLGVPFHNYVVAQRLEHSREVIASGKTIWEAAKSSGYSNLSSFGHAFKHHFGIRPSDARGSGKSEGP